LVDPLPELARIVDDPVLGALDQRLRAVAEDEAVDGALLPVALEQIEEAEPLAFRLRTISALRIASGGVEQDRVGAEPPVTVARSSLPAQPLGRRHGGEVESGVQDRGRLSD